MYILRCKAGRAPDRWIAAPADPTAIVPFRRPIPPRARTARWPSDRGSARSNGADAPEKMDGDRPILNTPPTTR